MKVVLVSGSRDLAETVSLFLKVRWPELTLLNPGGGREAVELIYREDPDMVMIDHRAPSVDCFDLTSQIRSYCDVPIVVLGESDDVVDQVRALETGADDWIDPSSVPMGFIAKVSAILRRCSRQDDSVSRILDGKLVINHATREVFVSGNKAKLTPIEYKILCHLVENQGKVVTTRDLLCHVWGPNYESDKEILKINICRLRHKIEEDPANPEIVLSERGVGYIVRPLIPVSSRAS